MEKDGAGFYYCQSRYYDPEIGRWVNADGYAATAIDSRVNSRQQNNVSVTITTKTTVRNSDPIKRGNVKYVRGWTM